MVLAGGLIYFKKCDYEGWYGHARQNLSYNGLLTGENHAHLDSWQAPPHHVNVILFIAPVVAVARHECPILQLY